MSEGPQARYEGLSTALQSDFRPKVVSPRLKLPKTSVHITTNYLSPLGLSKQNCFTLPGSEI